MTPRITIALVTTLSFALLSVAAVAQPADAPLYHGEAFGSTAFRLGAVLADESAPVTIRCGADYMDSTASGVDGGALFQIQQVSSLVMGTGNSGSVGTTSRSVVHGVSLLDGLVTASSLTAVSRTTWSDGHFETDSTGTSFGSVSVGGLPVTDFPPNERRPIPGVGWVVINEQIPDVRHGAASLQINMLHVFINVSGPFGAAGTQIVVGSAMSRLEHTPGTLSGFAYGTSSVIPGGESSSPSAWVDMPCGGTGGGVLRERRSGMKAWPVLKTGSIVNTAVGLTDGDVVLGETVAKVAAIDVLQGRVRVDRVVVTAGLNGQGADLELGGSAFFTNLVIDGLDMPVQSPVNTFIHLPGIGMLGINVQVTGADERTVTERLTVTALEVLVNEDNELDLPIGTRVEVGVASVAVAQ